MADRISLDDQLMALNSLRARAARKLFEWGDRPDIVYHKLACLDASIKTLEFLRAHEDIIRDAIASAKALDAADTYG